MNEILADRMTARSLAESATFNGKKLHRADGSPVTAADFEDRKVYRIDSDTGLLIEGH